MENYKKQLVYQAANGAIALREDASADAIWATQAQMAAIFERDQSVISRHIKNIFKDEEVDLKSNMQNMHIAGSDKPVTYYSLDVILSVGYRTNSSRAIDFRKWATKVLKSYISSGFVIDKKRVAVNYTKFLDAVDKIKALSLGKEAQISHDATMNLVSEFAKTWVSLDAYDKSALPKSGTSKQSVKVTSEDLNSAIIKLKADLISKNQATELFAALRNPESLESIVGNVFQSFDGKDVYETSEEKAAHLLYFIVKNHIFSDGNKRSGAFAFVWFLKQADILDESLISPNVLTTLTLLIAESEPAKKDQCIGLVLLLLRS